MSYTTQFIEPTDMVPITVGERLWMCRAQRENRFRHIYASLMDCADIDGDIAEMGCWIGLTSSELARWLDEQGSAKTLHCFEHFKGLDRHDAAHDLDRGEWIALPDMREQFLSRMRNRWRWRLHDQDLGMYREWSKPLSWAYVDVDIYQPTLDAIALIWRNMVPGGVAVFDDYGAERWWPGVRKAVDETLGRSAEWELQRMPNEGMWLCLARRKG